jgi:hypothetical protein
VVVGVGGIGGSSFVKSVLQNKKHSLYLNAETKQAHQARILSCPGLCGPLAALPIRASCQRRRVSGRLLVLRDLNIAKAGMTNRDVTKALGCLTQVLVEIKQQRQESERAF